MAYRQVVPTSFTFSDGVSGHTVTSATLLAGFYVQTDANGVIDGCYIGASPDGGYVQSQVTRYDGAQFDSLLDAGFLTPAPGASASRRQAAEQIAVSASGGGAYDDVKAQ